MTPNGLMIRFTLLASLALIVLLAVPKPSSSMCQGVDIRCYATNDRTITFGDVEIPGADAATFQVLENPTPAPCGGCHGNIYARDKDSIYIAGIPMRKPKVDPDSIRYLGSGMFVDKDHVYYQSVGWGAEQAKEPLTVLEGFDPKTFQRGTDGHWQDDKMVLVDISKHFSLSKKHFHDYGGGYVGDETHVYSWGCYNGLTLIKDADVSSFKGLYNAYALDRGHAYWCGNVLKDADPETFHMDQKTGKACDKLGCFEFTNRVNGSAR